MSINPYIFFSGDCAEAFKLYQQILGGDLQVMTHADLPPDAEPMPGAEDHHVMHAALTLPGDGGVIMGSDDPSGDGGPKKGIGVTFTHDDPEEARRVFEALSEGGQKWMEFEPTFFSRGFGSCNDRFGVNWMIDTADEAG